jgi:trehalose 6-phosphate phosphatase
VTDQTTTTESSVPTAPPDTTPLFCLFLDVDGTLLDIAPTPGEVHVDPELVELLRQLERACDGALALISGRPIVELDDLFAPLFLSVAGVHGCERRDASGRWYRPTFGGATLEPIRAELEQLLTQFHGTLVEDKGCALAVHFRKAPYLEEVLKVRLSGLLARTTDYELLEGDHVIEIKPVAQNKASAIEAFMQEEPFAGRTPIFIGDDTTDLDGFAAVRRMRGKAISVGNRVIADEVLRDPPAVRKWLSELLCEMRR